MKIVSIVARLHFSIPSAYTDQVAARMHRRRNVGDADDYVSDRESHPGGIARHALNCAMRAIALRRGAPHESWTAGTFALTRRA
jgi:uncharacterized protein YqjF (DUF2071 family)